MLRNPAKESTYMIAPLGNYFVDRDQPQLSSEEEEVVRQFHDLYYRHWLVRKILVYWEQQRRVCCVIGSRI
jgi:hypothetical protein